MTYTFNGISIINTETHEEYDTHVLDDMETLTEHLNNLNNYKKAITIDRDFILKGIEDPQLTDDYRRRLFVKLEALNDTINKAKIMYEVETDE